MKKEKEQEKKSVRTNDLEGKEKERRNGSSMKTEEL